ncbi:MAG TPA: hypothetical protein VMH81_38820 [Bryobacteraceae bacterium]|nr:hypothetical protein [Bryobacteraceae bacterium]
MKSVASRLSNVAQALLPAASRLIGTLVGRHRVPCRPWFPILLCIGASLTIVRAQDPVPPKPAGPTKSDQTADHSQMKGMDHSQMQGMDHSKMQGMAGMEGMDMSDEDPAESVLMGQASGTSMGPKSWPMPMRMVRLGSWRTMFMGNAFLVETQQSGPRGGDKLYGPNWFMGEAEHRIGKGSFLFQLMLSLEPATVTGRAFPELFQTGETAFGKPLVDAQHPHNLIMAIGFNYARPVAENTVLQFYFAPVGDPALGPVAFPHRASASELPQAPLGHHWQDSSHIADEVVTVGVTHQKVRLEASGFYGTEPGENRWILQTGPINSWATRFSVFPSKNWMVQVSAGRLNHPERQSPGDVFRSTASLHYTKPRAAGSWSSSLIWGRNHDTFTHRNLNSYLAESEFPLTRRNFLTGRAELVDKDELFDDQPSLEEQLDRTVGSTFRIAAYTAGYTRDVFVSRLWETGIGANLTTYTVPQAIHPYYGGHPVAVSVFLRVRLR